MKFDELELLRTIQSRTALPEKFPWVREVCAEIGMNEKRAAYICAKWTDKGWYEYGVNVLAGWLTEVGMSLDVNNVQINTPNGEIREVRLICADRPD